MKVWRAWVILAAIVALTAGPLFQTASARAGQSAGAASLIAQAPEPRFFPETGHYVSGRFREFWESQGGLLIFGLPLTSQFMAVSTDGNAYTVQYFERAVFELHPENAPPFDVLLTLIGNEITAKRLNEAPFQPAPRNNFGAGYAAATQHTIGAAFLTWWTQNGGLQTFGYPLSEEFREVNQVDGNEYLVQYFERARFEYHPENADPRYQVLLGLLGYERMLRVGVPASARARETTPGGLLNGSFSSTGYPFLKGPAVGLGIQAHYYGQPRARLIGLVKDIGFGWTKQQIVWKDVERQKGQYAWGELDEIVSDINAANLRLVLTVVKSPAWATPNGDDGLPRDPQDYADFMRAIATRYKNKVAAYEIWNEENHAGETGGRIDAAFYVEMLKAAYLAVKAADPNCIVILGGLAPTGVNDPRLAVDDTIYLEQLFQYQGGVVRDYYDVLGMHAYGMSNPPDTLWSEGKLGPERKYYDHDSFYFRRVEALYAIMQKYGDGQKQVWLTEWGWGSDFRPDGYGEFNTVTEAMRANYVTGAIQLSQQRYPWMGVMLLWNLNWSVISPWYSGPAHYSIINANYSPRPVYNALKALPK